jgi:Mrp family chromosome partitioning ATPase
MDLATHLAALQLVVVTGKGGVGKTAVSAALGRLLAAAGRRVLVLEVDPRENVHQMLGVAPSGGEMVRALPHLWVQNLKPGQVLDAIVRERLKLELVSRRVLASPIYQQFTAGAPGLKELAILGHALRLLRRLDSGPELRGAPAPEIDLVILDAPATGHGVRLLAAPQLVAGVIGGGPFGALAGDLAGFVADPARCGIVVVTQAEEMPVEEALELREALASQVRRQPELLVVNGLFPPLGALEAALDEGSVTGEAALDFAALRLWRQRRRINERELERLAAWWEGPRVLLPQLALGSGPPLIAALELLLRRGLEAADGLSSRSSQSSPPAPPAAPQSAGTPAGGAA